MIDLNKLQQNLADLENQSWYFKENSNKLDKHFLGSLLNSKIDRNYRTIKNLTQLLEDSESNTNVKKVSLDLDLAIKSLKQEILPLEKIIKINFTTFKGLNFETFDWISQICMHLLGS